MLDNYLKKPLAPVNFPTIQQQATTEYKKKSKESIFEEIQSNQKIFDLEHLNTYITQYIEILTNCSLGLSTYIFQIQKTADFQEIVFKLLHDDLKTRTKLQDQGIVSFVDFGVEVPPEEKDRKWKLFFTSAAIFIQQQ